MNVGRVADRRYFASAGERHARHSRQSPARNLPRKRGSSPSDDVATAILRALWTAHPAIMAVKVDYHDPPITVDVALPADGSLGPGRVAS
jgi:hypothetical protein